MKKTKPKSPAASENAANPGKPDTSKQATATDGKKGEVETGADNANDPKKAQITVEFSMSNGLVRRLANLGISLALSSYQSGVLYLLGRNRDNGLNVHQSAMPKPMGLRSTPDGGLTMTAGFQIMRFENVLKPNEQINHTFDVCYVPRLVHITGALDAHDVGIDDQNRPVFVNTRYNCLSVPSRRHSFEMIWKPDFITELVDEDRCHLNGLAMEDGKPKYVTAVSRSNTIDGWRDRRGSGGVAIDVEKNEIICECLSMPHSPRLHNGKLWLLNAGTGELGFVKFPGDDEESSMGTFEPVAFCPGFLRGLTFHGNLAFVGLSRPRYKRFEGLELDKRLKQADSEAWCGIQIIDLDKGTCVDWFRIDGDVGEIYDVEIIPKAICPMAVAPMSAETASLITFEDPAKIADSK